jgi:WD40 repeat protein
MKLDFLRSLKKRELVGGALSTWLNDFASSSLQQSSSSSSGLDLSDDSSHIRNISLDCTIETVKRVRLLELLPALSSIRTTIALSISHDGCFLASSHGDHTVKVYDLNTKSCKQIHTLVGHPRTPWVLAFHPSDSTILASGCIGHEVRVWSITSSPNCLSVFRFTYSIISLSFSPDGQFLAVSSSREIHFQFWGVGGSKSSDMAPLSGRYLRHSKAIHAVKFHPLGGTLFVAAVNAVQNRSRNGPDCKVLYSVPLFSHNDPRKEDYDVVNGRGSSAMSLDMFPCIITGIHLFTDSGIDVSKDGNHLLVVRQTQTNAEAKRKTYLSVFPSISSPETSVFAPDRIEMYRILIHHEAASKGGCCTLQLTLSHSLAACFVNTITSIAFSPSERYCIFTYGKTNGKTNDFSRGRSGIISDENVVCEIMSLYPHHTDNSNNNKERVSVTKKPRPPTNYIIVGRADEINVAKFHPVDGCGFFYGTKDGFVNYVALNY